MKLAPFLLTVAICCITTASDAAILNVQTVTSSKGITAWLVEDHSVPVISLRFMFKGAGAVNDPDDKQGVSQILSNTLDEGAGDLDSKAFQAALNDHSISLGFNSSRDDFGGSVKTLSTYQDTAFHLLSLALTKPKFDANPISRMVESNLVRIRSSMTDPEWMSARLTNATIFAGHPYAINSGGTLSSLPKITADDLRHKFKTQFAKDNLIVAVAGDIRKEQLAAVLDQTFGDIPATSTTRHIDDVTMSNTPETVLYQQDIPQTVINMVLPGIPHDDSDYQAAEIMNFVFGSSGFGSRLTDEIREKRGLTYGIYSDLNEMRSANLLTIGASTRNESAQQVIDLTKEVMAGLIAAPVRDAEITDAKTYLIGAVPLQLTSTDSISAMLIGFQRDNLPPNYLDLRQTDIKNVSVEDVQRVAKRLLQPENLKIMLVGNPKLDHTVKTVLSLPNVE